MSAMTEQTNKKNDRTERSRTEYSAMNTTAAMATRVISIVMGFATRVVFTHVLSENYVGVNGLFVDIINVLSLSELGVGTAITYALYRPIAEKDVEKQKSLMQLFQFLYRVIAGIVLAGGLAVIPFMPLLVRDHGEIDHLILLYLIYLANSALSNLYVYKRTMLDACQLMYIGTIYYGAFLVLQYILQIIVLALKWGPVGVFLGTFVSTVTTSTWVEPWVLYKFRFERRVGSYFMLYGMYTAIVAAAAYLTHAVCMRITGGLWQILILRGFVCVILPNALLLLIYWRTATFQRLLRKGMGLLRKKRK